MTALRQWLFPREFRIDSPPWPKRELAALEKAAGALAATPGGGAPGAPGAVGPPGAPDPLAREQERFLADVATGLWRMKRRLETDEAARRACQFIFESVWDALTQGGVEIKDHTGEHVTGGEALRVVAFEPTPGLTREQVIETVRPTVYYHGKSIQMGQVIIGKPAPAADTA
jgi:hypothetical protein